ncbi:MAG TPA: glycosyltransferase [Patescibacteria group bacterium]
MKNPQKEKLMIVFYDMALGGIQRKIIDIMEHLNKNRPKTEIVLCVIKTDGIFMDKIPAGVIIETPPFYFSRFYMFWFIAWMSFEIIKHSPSHILSFMDVGSVPTLFALKAVFWKKPKVVIGEDILTSKYVYIESQPQARLKLIKNLYPLASKILVQTPVQQQDLKQIASPHAMENVVVSPNWLPLEFPPSNIVKSPRSTDILFMGRIEAQKNLHRFVEIIKIVHRYYPDLSVKIVGEGSQLKEIKQLVHRQKLDRTISFLPPTKNPAQYYLNSKIFLLTSDYEGFPLTLMEAVSCGCYPVLINLPEISQFFNKYQPRFIFKDISGAVSLIHSALKKPDTKALDHYRNLIISRQSKLISQYITHIFS